MLRYAIFPVFLSLILISCITPETQRKIDQASVDVITLRAQLGKAIATGASQIVVDGIQTRLDAAETKLSSLEDQGAKERQEMAGGIQTALTKGDYIGAAVIAIGGLIAGFGGFKGIKKITTSSANKKKAKLAATIKEVIKSA